MENLKIHSTPKTPLIDFDLDSNVFLIAGISVPENSLEFYGIIIKWLKEYVKSPNSPIKLVFRLTYVNTSSLQFIYDLLMIFGDITNKSNIIVEWYYLDEDEDMQEMGEDFREATNLKFSFFAVETV